MHLRTILSAAIVAAVAHVAASAQAAPKVVTTIAPIHSLTAMIMEGIADPVMLVPPGDSPHNYALRPSEARALDEAEVVVWVGESLETFMSRPLAALAADARTLTLAEVPGLRTLAARDNEDWPAHTHEHNGHGHGHSDAHNHGHGHSHGHGRANHQPHGHAQDHGHGHAHADEGVDPHLWLSVHNAKIWLAAIADTLAEADPANAATYRTNAERSAGRIEALEAEIEQILAPVRDVPYVVFHDAYQYFENRFQTNAVGSVSPSDAQQPGAAHVRDLRQRIRDQNVVCIFSEPQFEPRLVATMAEGTEARAGVLDPLGSDLEPGPELFPSLMLDLARSLRDCLA